MTKMSHVAVLVSLMSAAPFAFQGDQAEQRSHLSAMMKSCRDQMTTRQADVDRLAQRIAEARRSNDPDLMRSTLDETQKQFSARQERSAACMQMMDVVTSMQRGGMSGMGGMSQSQPAGTAGMMPGACCAPGRPLHGVVAIAAWTAGALLFLATLAVLGALALFLWRQAQATSH